MFRVKDINCQQLYLTNANAQELHQQELKDARLVKHLEPCLSDGGSEGRDSVAIMCRFCWSAESTEENPCIVPCKCSGSVGFIHYKCLRDWLQVKMQSRETDNYTTLFWKNFECEICKFGYPYLFRVNQKLYKLVDIKKPRTGNYMVMESLPLEKNTSRTIHVLIFSPEHDRFTMGRGHESLIRVNDISVSRLHAILKQTNEGIFIQDNQSKFGTLVLIKENELKLEHEKNYIFQVGRSVLSIHIT